jgi:hypothetical protein
VSALTKKKTDDEESAKKFMARIKEAQPDEVTMPDKGLFDGQKYRNEGATEGEEEL